MARLMSKAAKIVGIVATVVAVVASIAIIIGSGGTAAPLVGATWAEVAAIAGAVAAVASVVAQVTAKAPDARGTINQVIIGRNMAVPYALGRTYAGGMQVYDRSGGEDNKDRTQIMVLSGAGPVQSLDNLLADYTVISLTANTGGKLGEGEAVGYYEDHLWVDSRLGLRPETAITNGPTRSPLPEWDSTYKLSGFAAYRVTMKFDKDGERYAAGVPQWGVVFKGVKVYDPRLDSTYPGGSGACRFGDEATFVYSENPALHALTYARGRYIEKSAAGATLNRQSRSSAVASRATRSNWRSSFELANLCDANVWKVGGLIYEAPGSSKWDNLKRILQAAAAEPVWSGGKLGVKISAPRTPVVTIGLPDLADGEQSVQAMKTWRDKVNTVVPRVRLEAHRWEYTQLDEVTSSTYLTEDGEPKSTEVQFDLCQQADQGAELAAYTLVNGREFGPILLSLKPYFMIYKVGEAVTVNLPELGMTNQTAIIVGRQIDPQTGSVQLNLESETAAKHAFALGRTGVAPPTPTLIPPSTQDNTNVIQNIPVAQVTSIILNSWPTSLTLSITAAGAVTVSNHSRVYSDKTVAVTGATVPAPAGATAGDKVAVYYDQQLRTGGVVSYLRSRLPGGVGESTNYFASTTHPYRHFVGMLTIPASGTSSGSSGTSGGGGGSPGGGWSGEGAVGTFPRSNIENPKESPDDQSRSLRPES